MEVRNDYIGEQSLLYLMCGRYSKYWKFDSQLATDYYYTNTYQWLHGFQTVNGSWH